MSSGVNLFLKIVGNLEAKISGITYWVYPYTNAFLAIPFIQSLGNIQSGSNKSATYRVNKVI